MRVASRVATDEDSRRARFDGVEWNGGAGNGGRSGTSVPGDGVPSTLGRARRVPAPCDFASLRLGGFSWLTPVSGRTHAGAGTTENHYRDEGRCRSAPLWLDNGFAGTSIRGAELRITSRSSGDRLCASGPRGWSNGVYRHTTSRRWRTRKGEADGERA